MQIPLTQNTSFHQFIHFWVALFRRMNCFQRRIWPCAHSYTQLELIWNWIKVQSEKIYGSLTIYIQIASELESLWPPLHRSLSSFFFFHHFFFVDDIIFLHFTNPHETCHDCSHMGNTEYKVCVPRWACPFMLAPPKVGEGQSTFWAIAWQPFYQKLWNFSIWLLGGT